MREILVRFPTRARDISLPKDVVLISGANPVSCSAGLERPGHEADLQPPGSAKVKNGCIYTAIIAVFCHGVYKYKSTLSKFESLSLRRLRES